MARVSKAFVPERVSNTHVDLPSPFFYWLVRQGEQLVGTNIFPFAWSSELSNMYGRLDSVNQEHYFLQNDMLARIFKGKFCAIFQKNIDDQFWQKFKDILHASVKNFDFSLKKLIIVTSSSKIKTENIEGVEIVKIKNIFLKNNCDKLFHDRIILIDDYIWHYGAGVAGAYKYFQSYSGPWMDIDDKFKFFVKNLEREESCCAR